MGSRVLSFERIRKVIVIGLDGLDPKIVETLIAAGELPALAKLSAQGGYTRLATTYPPQTPVAWSTFATGVNPGGHGIFDFIRRRPETYLPDLALNQYEQKNAFSPPKAVNLRRGDPVWSRLSRAGIGSTIVRHPCTYPPDEFQGTMLSGMGTPDLRGGLGTSTFYTQTRDVRPRESENVVTLEFDDHDVAATNVLGPRKPRTHESMLFPIKVHVNRAARTATIRCEGSPRELTVAQGAWSEWLRVKFKAGLLQSIWGIVRFRLIAVDPVVELYASPVNFDPDAPLFPIGFPAAYPKELAEAIGLYYTTGMVEDHAGLDNERIDEAAFLDQCAIVRSERERMATRELERFDQGLFYCLFDTPDRVQHMFWRFRERDHPANRGRNAVEFAATIDDEYRAADRAVARLVEFADDRTLVVALSDHGFSSFQRGVNINTWLYGNKLLFLKDGVRPGEGAGDMFKSVDWTRTKAYAVGLSGIYLNIEGREKFGVVKADDARGLAAAIAEALSGFVDAERGTVAIRSASPRDQIYSGPYVQNAPDLVVNYSAGYRVSWSSSLGGFGTTLVEDNIKKWSGDHIIDPALVPGVLLMNRPFRREGASLVDLAPTILHALGAEVDRDLEGSSLLS